MKEEEGAPLILLGLGIGESRYSHLHPESPDLILAHLPPDLTTTNWRPTAQYVLSLIAEEWPEGSALSPVRPKARLGRYGHLQRLPQLQLTARQLQLQDPSPTRPVMPRALNSRVGILPVRRRHWHWSRRPGQGINSCLVLPKDCKTSLSGYDTRPISPQSSRYTLKGHIWASQGLSECDWTERESNSDARTIDVLVHSIRNNLLTRTSIRTPRSDRPSELFENPSS